MELIERILILTVSFRGIAYLIHICSKNKYAVEINFKERKIKVYPLTDKPNQPHR